jgi:hypothetical protein
MINFYFDDQQYLKGYLATKAMFEAIGRGEYEGYTSTDVVLELKNAEEPKRSNMLSLIEKYKLITLEIADNVVNLSNLYINAGIIPTKYRYDASHIAYATVNGLDVLLSFNFRHINKPKTKTMTEDINRFVGYNGIKICTPTELLGNEK